MVGACARTQSGGVWSSASDGAFECCRCDGRVGQDEGLGLVVFGRTTIPRTIVIMVLKEINRALFCALLEPLPADCEEDDERESNRTDNATNNATHYGADVYM